MSSTYLRPLGPGLAAALLVAVLALLVPPDRLVTVLVARPPQASPVALVTAGCGLIAWLLAGWLAGIGLLVAVSRAPGRLGRVAYRAATKACPGIARATLCLLLGTAAAAVGGSGLPASAAGPPPSGCPSGRPVPPPDWAARAPAATRHHHAVWHDPAAGALTVRAGDSLWAIAARHPAGQSTAAVAAAWPRWYAANRAVIGPQPDLIYPGERLLPPPPLDRRNDRDS